MTRVLVVEDEESYSDALAYMLRKEGFDVAIAATGPDANEQQTEGMAYGDPARIIRAVKKWESLGVDCINFILNANEVVPQEQVMASLKLFAKEVMPHFAKKPTTVAAAAE